MDSTPLLEFVIVGGVVQVEDFDVNVEGLMRREYFERGWTGREKEEVESISGGVHEDVFTGLLINLLASITL